MDNLVSIITPSYNTALYIEDTIKSVLNQTFKNWEMIIVDDCSSDNTLEIINKFNDPRIILIRNNLRCGAAVSRNKALNIAKGKWIAFLDSDDLWMPDKLEKQIDFMIQNEISFSYTDYKVINEEGITITNRITGPKKISRRGMYNYCWPGCLTVMYNQEKVGLIQIENLKKNNDYAIWLKVIKKSDCYLLEEVLGSYRKRKGSISNQSFIKLIKYHYYLFYYAERMNATSSLLHALNNLFFGCVKKLVYRR